MRWCGDTGWSVAGLGKSLCASAFAALALLAAPQAHADDGNLYTLVDTAAQRLLTADDVAAFKWTDGGPITDPARVKVVLDAVAANAATQRIDPAYVREVFTDQINATEGVEYARFGQWKLDPGAAPTSAPDLSTSRSAIDGFNRTMVNEMAVHWDSLHGPACPAQRDDAVNAVVAARGFDPLYAQALQFATHAYCR